MSNSTSTPSNTYDIDRYRRAKKRKKLINRLLLVVLALVVVGLVYCIVETIIQTAQAEKGGGTHFPVSLTGEDPIDLLATQHGLLVVGEDKLLGYTNSAKKDLDLVHNMTEPVCVCVKDRVLTYDQEGYAWQVSKGNEVLYSQTTENQIIFGRMYDNGMVALATFEDRFYGSIIVYSKDFQQIYKYSDSQNFITGFEFLSRNKGLLIAQTVSGITIDTVLTGLDFTKDEETKYFTTTLEDTVVYAARPLSDGGALLVTSQGIMHMASDGSTTTTETLDGDLRAVSNDGSLLVVATENLQDINCTDLYVINSGGSIAAQTTVPSVLQDLYCDKSEIVCLDHDFVWVYDYGLSEKGVYQNDASYTQAVRYGGGLYGMSSELLQPIEVKAEKPKPVEEDETQQENPSDTESVSSATSETSSAVEE